MRKQSAGVLAFREVKGIEVLLVHPGGPFYTKKDLGAWSIPKGEFTTEQPLDVAIREFTEETGNIISHMDMVELFPVKLKSGKTIFAWAVEADFENAFINSNTFEIEWPPKSGKMVSFPEVDKAEWFTIDIAKEKIHSAQISLLEQLQQLKSSG